MKRLFPKNKIKDVLKQEKAPMTFVIEAFGGDNRDRTGDLLNAIQALSQLSYTPTGLDYNIRLTVYCQQLNYTARSVRHSFLLSDSPPI